MSGYYHECPHCNGITPINPNDLLHRATRPDVTCCECGDDGCITCMPDEMCSECEDRLDDDDGWDADDDGETYLNDSGD